VRVAVLIGQNIRSLRRAAGLTQADLADALREAGLKTWQRQTVAETESGRRDITVEELVVVAAFFEVPLSGLIVSPGGAVSIGTVKVGRRRLRVEEWVNLIEQGRGPLEKAGSLVQRAIDALVGDLPRPWAKRWRRSGNGPSAYAAARDELLAARTRLPGPTVVWDGEGGFEISTAIPPWGANIRVKLEPGVPYVARDEYEAEELRKAAKTHRELRLITRQEAYRLRQKGGS
jgi:transcriptional regulator with XRE-family HTH domain